MPQFDPTFFASQIFWLVIFFGLLLFVMHRIIVPYIRQGINQRAQYVLDLKNKEDSYLIEIDRLSRHMSELQRTYHERSQRVIENTVHGLSLDKEKTLHELNERLNRQRELFLKKLEQEISEMSIRIPEIADELTTLLLNKLLKTSPVIEE